MINNPPELTAYLVKLKLKQRFCETESAAIFRLAVPCHTDKSVHAKRDLIATNARTRILLLSLFVFVI